MELPARIRLLFAPSQAWQQVRNAEGESAGSEDHSLQSKEQPRDQSGVPIGTYPSVASRTGEQFRRDAVLMVEG